MAKIHNIDANKLHKLLKAKQALLIDVREPAEYQSESIQGAHNLPLAEVTIDKIELLADTDKKLVFHCLSGKRSLMACNKLQNDDIEFDLYNLQGGISSWKNEKLPILTSARKILPLDRQVQLAIGLMIVFGLILNYFLNSIWLILPLIAGFGLINAAITGWCGLARLIAKMPWNK